MVVADISSCLIAGVEFNISDRLMSNSTLAAVQNELLSMSTRAFDMPMTSHLGSSIKSRRSKEETKIIRKAFNLAVNAHRDVRRKSGEPYIFHPLAVARICGDEIGLGTTSIVCALLHDTVEDTSITLNDIDKIFGQKVFKPKRKAWQHRFRNSI